MKNLTFTLTLLSLCLALNAQKSAPLLSHYENEWRTFQEFIAMGGKLQSDTNIDVKFYHISLKPNIETPYLEGHVRDLLEPAVPGLTQFTLNLNSALNIDSISSPCTGFTHTLSNILVQLDGPHNPGDLVDITVWYQGTPALAGGYKGFRYETHGNNEPVIATLSTPYLAHYWYPCSDGPGDKPDSVYVDITIPDVQYAGIPLTAVSNGLLESVTQSGNEKTFHWRHRYPVVTYYVMAAISNYVLFSQQCTGSGGESFPLDYYVFNSDLAISQQGVEQMPEAMQFFTETFGAYPFENEKYGMTQLGYYGAIENQTNTIINNMSPSWFTTSVHELSHMWFGDMITCADWHHGWLNEGFATYSEALWAEHEGGYNAYKANMAENEFMNGGTLYLQNAADTFQIFVPIIYQKGAYVLHMLRHLAPDSLFFAAIKSYSENPALKYGHATTEDLQAIFGQVYGMDLGFFFDQWIYDEYWPFYFYNFIQPPGEPLQLAVKQMQQQLWNRRPLFIMPLDIRFVYQGGGDTVIQVWNDAQYQQFSFELPFPVESVEIDPEKWVLRKTQFSPELPVGTGMIREQPGLTAWPVPCRDAVFVNIPECGDEEYLVTVYSLFSEKVGEFPVPGGTARIGLAGYSPGVYLLRITGESGLETRYIKIVKQ